MSLSQKPGTISQKLSKIEKSLSSQQKEAIKTIIKEATLLEHHKDFAIINNEKNSLDIYRWNEELDNFKLSDSIDVQTGIKLEYATYIGYNTYLLVGVTTNSLKSSANSLNLAMKKGTIRRVLWIEKINTSHKESKIGIKSREESKIPIAENEHVFGIPIVTKQADGFTIMMARGGGNTHIFLLNRDYQLVSEFDIQAIAPEIIDEEKNVYMLITTKEMIIWKIDKVSKTTKRLQNIHYTGLNPNSVQVIGKSIIYETFHENNYVYVFGKIRELSPEKWTITGIKYYEQPIRLLSENKIIITRGENINIESIDDQGNETVEFSIHERYETVYRFFEISSNILIMGAKSDENRKEDYLMTVFEKIEEEGEFEETSLWGYEELFQISHGQNPFPIDVSKEKIDETVDILGKHLNVSRDLLRIVSRYI